MASYQKGLGEVSEEVAKETDNLLKTFLKGKENHDSDLPGALAVHQFSSQHIQPAQRKMSQSLYYKGFINGLSREL